MATKIITQTTCDVCGRDIEEGTQHPDVRFSWAGTPFTIDLCDDHFARAESTIATLINAGRKLVIRDAEQARLARLTDSNAPKQTRTKRGPRISLPRRRGTKFYLNGKLQMMNANPPVPMDAARLAKTVGMTTQGLVDYVTERVADLNAPWTIKLPSGSMLSCATDDEWAQVQSDGSFGTPFLDNGGVTPSFPAQNRVGA